MATFRALACLLACLLGCSSSPRHLGDQSPTMGDGGAAEEAWPEPLEAPVSMGGSSAAGERAAAGASDAGAPASGGAAAGASPTESAGAAGAAGAPETEEPKVLFVERVWITGQSLADGPALGSPPPETPLAAVPMWVRDGTGVAGPSGQNFDAFTALQQPPGFGHGQELQMGVNLLAAGYNNIQVKIAKGATPISQFAPGGSLYFWLQEEVPQVLVASAAAFPGATFRDHLVLNCGQYETTASVEDYALLQTYYIGQVRAGYEALLGHALSSLHVELVRLDIPGGTWGTTTRAQQLAVPNAYFTKYDDVPLGGDGLHPLAAGQNTMGARVAISIRQSIEMGNLSANMRLYKEPSMGFRLAAVAPQAQHFVTPPTLRLFDTAQAGIRLALVEAVSSGAPAAPEFVAAGPGRIIYVNLASRTIRVSIEEDDLIRPFAPKPPQEVDSINFDYTARLAARGDSIATIQSVEVVGSPDGALVLSDRAHANGVVSAEWTGGTLDIDYTLECIVTTVGGRTWPVRATVTIAY